MSWNKGSMIFSEIISVLKENISDEDIRKDVYIDLIAVFEDADCDTLYECLNEDSAFDSAYEKLNPDHFEELKEDEDWGLDDGS